MAIIRKTKQQMWKRVWRKWNTHTLLIDYKLVQLLWKSVWRFLQKLKTELPYYSAIPLLGVYLKECKFAYNRDTCTPMFKQHYSISVQCVYKMEYQKKETMLFAGKWMELEIIMLNEISQTE
jgi:hypothetical protein